jgi:hypothetical protein
MAVRDTAVFAIYSDRLNTEIAIETLRVAGFRSTDISALFPDEVRTKDFAQPKQVKVPLVAAFALTGAMVSELLVWLASAGTNPIPGAGVLASAIPQITTFAGLVAGGVLGYLFVSLAGTKRHDSDERYDSRVRRGDILISVHCDNSHWRAKAKEILKRTGGDDVASMTKVTTVSPSLRIVSGRGLDREALNGSRDQVRSKSHGESSVA